MQTPSRSRQRWFWLAILFGLYTVLALLTMVGAYVSEGLYSKPGTLKPLLIQQLKSWYACAVVSLAVIWFCGRNRHEPGHITRWVLGHFAGALVTSVACPLLAAWLMAGGRSLIFPNMVLTFSYVLRTHAVYYVMMNLFVYGFVVAAHSGWTYYQRFRERELQAACLQRELVEARLEALRMQLNPHFLFNTLHAVSALIHENPDAADRVVARLSELLRLSLDQSKPQEVPLTEELAFLDRYLEIEQTRFAERLRVEKQIEPGAQQALVPFLILQPLVENAIRHGIEPREDQGVLAIRASRGNGRLQLRVADNGPGLPESATAPPRDGIGLSNTRSRLRHLYGESFQFEIVSAEGGGLEARLEIPYRTNASATSDTP